MTMARRRLRVLMSTDTLGGIWMYAIELARALHQHGVQVVLATMGRALSDEQRRQSAQVDDLIVCESCYRLEWMEHPWQDVDRAGHWLLGLERRYRPDLVHLNHYSHGHLDWHAPHLVVGHSCVLSWRHAVLCEQPPDQWRAYQYRVRRGLRGANLVLAPSRSMLMTLEHLYGPFTWTGVIHNGRTPGDYYRREKHPCILAVGRLWDAAKNLETLVQIAPALRWPVYVAGELSHPDGGEASIQHVGLLGQLGLSALAKWYAHASIYALPARYEPFGLSVLEAALSGCAPVIGDIDSLRELWDGAACFAPPNDPEALQAVINGLAEDPHQRHQVAQRARERARRYTTTRMVGAYLNAYQALLAGRGKSSTPARATTG